MANSYPITISLKNELREYDNPVARMLVDLVGEYERDESACADEVFGCDLAERLELVCAPRELSDLCLRIYAAVAKDIAMFAQDHDFNKDRRDGTIQVLLDEFESKIHNRDEHDEPMDDLFDPTELLDDLVKAGWDPKAENASGWTMLHDLAGDETMEPSAAYAAIQWLLERGANVNATDDRGASPLHLAAITGFGVVSTLLAFGADKTLRTTSPADIPLYAARGSIIVPPGSTAYDLTRESDLPEEIIAELVCDFD